MNLQSLMGGKLRDTFVKECKYIDHINVDDKDVKIIYFTHFSVEIWLANEQKTSWKIKKDK